MKALLSRLAGGPETLRIEDVPPPRPGPGQVLVRVAAVSLNYPDALMIEDRYQTRPPRPFAPGGELAGTIEALGEGVDQFRVGDRILGMTGWGGMAELVAVEASRTFVIPDAMPFDEAASLIFTYGTTIHGLLDRGGLKSGQTVLVLGAAGGIGISAIELGKAFGARVVAAVSSEHKAQVAYNAGADDVVLYPSAPFDAAMSKDLARRFKAAGPGGFDVVYDPVGGQYADPALRAIGWEGRYVVVGFTGGIPQIPLNLALLKACSIVGVFWGAWADRNPQRLKAEIDTLMGFWSNDIIKPRISERFTLENAPAAIARMSERAAVGKMVMLF